MDDVFLGKMTTIERCLARVHEEYAGTAASLANITKQDAIVLNLQRACEAAIDLAMHTVSAHRLGIPKLTRDAFQMLTDAGLLSVEVGDRMKRMVGFRNTAVHDDQSIDIVVLQHIIEQRLGDFGLFVRELQSASVRA